ncbi:MAG TPA: CCA tRNA nucleotidyltransferase [Gemmatimonadales bacterium]|nr:CCA tRNA nucleotidyltransferase [Gemmatimonadales bacterium]
MSFPATLPIPDEVLEIARRLDDAGHEVWCVGGAIRDTLLRTRTGSSALEPFDVDFATSATPEQVQALFRRTVGVGIKHGTVGVLDRHRVLHEVTTFRRDVTTDGRHAVVAFGVSLADDLARRDFTINAIAYHPLRHEWRDPFDGAGDLARGLIRAVGDPAQRFREDYLRVLRAIRFAARFGFEIDAATWEAARAAGPSLDQLSAERVRDEWFKGLRTTRSVARLVDLWTRVGAADVWIPFRAVSFSAAEADRSPRDPVLLTSLLVADPAGALRRLRASNAEIARAEAIQRGPEEPAADTPEAVRRWRAVVLGAADDLMAIWRHRHGAVPGWAAAALDSRARQEPVTRGELAIDGSDIAAAGVPPGPAIGAMLDQLLDRVLTDPSLNTREQLAAIVRSRP